MTTPKPDMPLCRCKCGCDYRLTRHEEHAQGACTACALNIHVTPNHWPRPNN